MNVLNFPSALSEAEERERRMWRLRHLIDYDMKQRLKKKGAGWSRAEATVRIIIASRWDDMLLGVEDDDGRSEKVKVIFIDPAAGWRQTSVMFSRRDVLAYGII